MNVALLCDYRRFGAATVRQHIEALERTSQLGVVRVPVLGGLPPWLDLNRFDAVVIHYSLVACSDSYLNRRTRERLANYPGVKAAFVQDEYRHVDRTAAALREMGIQMLFTCVPEPYIPHVYGEQRLPGVKMIRVLTGYVPEALTRLELPPPSAKPLRVGYRGRYLPAWLGELGQEKWRMGARFLEDASAYGIECDISWREEDRIYGKRWVEFLTSCRAVLGVESGASVIDFTGEIQARTERYIAEHPDATFEEIRDACFPGEDGKYPLNQISPRCFEAAALRVVMILYEGAYSGVLEPWRHYIPLRKDHSNMPEVVTALKDGRFCDEMARRAYQEIALNPAYSWQAMVEVFEREIKEAVVNSSFRARQCPSWRLALDRIPAPNTLRRRVQRHAIERAHRWMFGKLFRGLDPKTRTIMKTKIKQFLASARCDRPS